MSKQIVFFGNERLATGVSTTTPIIRRLVLSGYNIVSIVITPINNTASRRPRPLEIVDFAKENSIPIISWTSLAEVSNELKKLNAEIGILAAFGKIIPGSIIDSFPFGIINVHPSLLPKHRGPIPIEAAILDGDEETGVSIMKLAPEMDSGPIYDQVKLKLSGRESKQDLANQLALIGSDKLAQLLPDILAGKAKCADQPSIGATYDKRISKDQGTLNFTKPAEILEREIRAFSGWPRSRTLINGLFVIITQASVDHSKAGKPGKIQADKSELAIATGEGRLIIERLIPAGASELTGAEFIRGYLNKH